MPFVEVKVFEDELTADQAKRLIEGITDTVTAVTSDRLRDVAWVTISEVKSGHWGFGGKALGLGDVRRLIAGG